VKRRGSVLVVAVMFALHPVCGIGQPYPGRPVKLVVAPVSGGQNDIIARVLAQPLGAATRFDVARPAAIIESARIKVEQ